MSWLNGDPRNRCYPRPCDATCVRASAQASPVRGAASHGPLYGRAAGTRCAWSARQPELPPANGGQARVRGGGSRTCCRRPGTAVAGRVRRCALVRGGPEAERRASTRSHLSPVDVPVATAGPTAHLARGQRCALRGGMAFGGSQQRRGAPPQHRRASQLGQELEDLTDLWIGRSRQNRSDASSDADVVRAPVFLVVHAFPFSVSPSGAGHDSQSLGRRGSPEAGPA